MRLASSLEPLVESTERVDGIPPTGDPPPGGRKDISPSYFLDSIRHPDYVHVNMRTRLLRFWARISRKLASKPQQLELNLWSPLFAIRKNVKPPTTDLKDFGDCVCEIAQARNRR
jgi:hypothetical protein